ncbi:hypothetical protein OBBRIDRAFT_71154 [Obba rivulosa]|uniref:Uncharacterized protein n=1 Tax=Obba rivulosa TaxID=1052685 RepID=A0A8E2AV30_9APHY|nr:hypothetical protein OBBRIDRAFT_71154 [Obba rivulosa]
MCAWCIRSCRLTSAVRHCSMFHLTKSSVSFQTHAQLTKGAFERDSYLHHADEQTICLGSPIYHMAEQTISCPRYSRAPNSLRTLLSRMLSSIILTDNHAVHRTRANPGALMVPYFEFLAMPYSKHSRKQCPFVSSESRGHEYCRRTAIIPYTDYISMYSLRTLSAHVLSIDALSESKTWS